MGVESAIKEIQEGYEKLFLNCLPGTLELSRSIGMAFDRIPSLPVDKNYVKKINRSIEIIIEETKKFIEVNSQIVDSMKVEEAPAIDDLTDTERNILEALADDTLTGADLFERA